MSKHTKGPWMAGAPVVYSDEDGEETIYQITVYSPKPREFGVAELVGSKAEIVPNARLIAAAPDLLEALERAHTAMSLTDRLAFFSTLEIVEAAIKKAKGEA